MDPSTMIKSFLKMKAMEKKRMTEWKMALKAHPQKVLTLN